MYRSSKQQPKKKNRRSSKATMRIIKAERRILRIVEQRIEKPSYRLEKFKGELRQASINFKEIIEKSTSCDQVNLAKQKLKYAIQNLHSAKHMYSNCRYVLFTNIFD